MALVIAAVAAGVTGAWSPCGFSMVETLAPSGYAGALRTTALACVTFAVGALAGGAITFGGLAALGAALGTGAPAAAALLALLAAAGEARGARIVPQVRRQVPESWRRVLPVPLAAGLYGVLLGLGFTTFILSFAVWALAGIAVALGDPAIGAAIGLGFGAGRAVPVVALAPSGGGRVAAAMAERPRILRGLRALDAAALAACAIVLWGAPAQAADIVEQSASDPSADGSALALHRPGAAGELRTGRTSETLPGPHPAVGGGHVAWVGTGTVEVRVTRGLGFVASVPAAGADAVAVSGHWVAWRATGALHAVPLAGGPERVVAAGAHPGRPALAGARLLYDVAERRIEETDLATGAQRTLRRAGSRKQLRQPSALGGRLLYVRAGFDRQELRLGRARPGRVGSDRVLYGTWPTGRRDRGADPGHEHAPGHRPIPWPPPPRGVHDTLWTTALTTRSAYVTRLRQRDGAAVQSTVLRVRR